MLETRPVRCSRKRRNKMRKRMIKVSYRVNQSLPFLVVCSGIISRLVEIMVVQSLLSVPRRVWIIGSLLIVLGSLLPDPVSLFLIPFNEIKDSEAWKAIKQQTVGNQIIF